MWGCRGAGGCGVRVGAEVEGTGVQGCGEVEGGTGGRRVWEGKRPEDTERDEIESLSLDTNT